MELSTNLRSTADANRELSGTWDLELLANLLHIENVWCVAITSGTGELLYSQQRRELPARCPELLDLTTGVIANAGERLHVGQLRFTMFMFGGALVVGRRSDSGASAFVLASPEANLGQLLAQIRRVHVGGEVWGERQS